jgi:small subunit ribosomal protein S6
MAGLTTTDQRKYEVLFIVRPDVAEEDVDKLIQGLEATITGGGGVLASIEKLGRRKLAYMVQKFNDGNFVLFNIESTGALIAEVERRLRVLEPVIKFISVRMDEEEKRANKIKALRAKRVKLSAQPTQAPVVAATPAPVESEVPAAVEAAPVTA